MPRYRLGIDVGGTHTDMVLLETGADGAAGRWRIVKIPSTPHNPALAVLDGVRQFVASGVDPADIEFFSHGTTATTNALLEMRGAKIGVLVNAGMRGILEVQSQARDGWPPFDHLFRKPEPLARPAFVREIPGRLDYAGREIEPLDEAAVAAAARELAGQGATAFAILFLFSFMNDAHEARAAGIVRSAVPGAFVSCSSQVLPRIREWPRYSTTMLNAYLGPVLSAYCRDMAKGLDENGVNTQQRFLMQSNGGVMPLVANAETHAVRTLLSGPAGGVGCASWLLGREQGWRNLVTMDIGGTSADIAFIEDGEPVEQSDSMVDGRIVGVPAYDIATVAAGGGSIAWINDGGMLEVGPHSAGADPGPVCYGRGGSQPTVTDANVVRGALNPDYFLGGKASLDAHAARAAIEDKIARAMDTDVATAASGIVRIVNARITDAIRVEAAKKGIDLTGHTLVPFGGAGPVHAAQVAEDLHMPRVLVPLNPGAFSALGLLCTDVRHDYMRSEMAVLSALDPSHAEQSFAALEDAAREEISGEGLNGAEIVYARELDLRYEGQGYELRVPLEGLPRPLGADALSRIAERFHDLHTAVHGHAARDAVVEVVSYRLRASVAMPKAASARAAAAGAAQPEGRRTLTLGPGRVLEASVWRRDALASGWSARGPAIIEQPDATTVVPDGWSVRCDDYANLVLERLPA
ncbi:MAG: hydantoinase/oxoprolinase family protein [Beijerinckiaceae bacterium]